MVFPGCHRHQTEDTRDEEQWTQPTQPEVEQTYRPLLACEDKNGTDQHAKREIFDKLPMKTRCWIAVHHEQGRTQQGGRQMERSCRVHANVNADIATEDAPRNQSAERQ